MGQLIATSLVVNTNIAGTATNDSANAGNLGEFVFRQVLTGSAIGLTTATPTNLGQTMTLSGGNWEIDGEVAFKFGAGTTITRLQGSISNSNTVLQPTSFGGYVGLSFPGIVPVTDIVLPIFGRGITVPSNSNFFLMVQADFTVSTCSVYGVLRARRTR